MNTSRLTDYLRRAAEAAIVAAGLGGYLVVARRVTPPAPASRADAPVRAEMAGANR